MVRFVLFASEHTAGGGDVLAARGAYGGGDAEFVEAVAECGHSCLVGGVQVAVGDGMEADEVDAALQPFEQARE